MVASTSFLRPSARQFPTLGPKIGILRAYLRQRERLIEYAAASQQGGGVNGRLGRMRTTGLLREVKRALEVRREAARAASLVRQNGLPGSGCAGALRGLATQSSSQRHS
jgi:hypothetical protein